MPIIVACGATPAIGSASKSAGLSSADPPAVFDLGRGLRRHRRAAVEPQDLRGRPRRIAGGGVDRRPHEIVAGAVDQISIAVRLKIAAPCVEHAAVEDGLAVADARRFCHREVAVPIDRHEGADRRGLDRSLDGVGGRRQHIHGVGARRARQVGVHEILEAGIRRLERGRLRVCDIARDILQCK
jgi:hypothetical protein